MINFEKLYSLRDRHSALHESFRSISAQSREAAEQAIRIRQECLVDPDNDAMADLLSLPPNELAKRPIEDLQKLGIDPRMVRRALVAHRRAETLKRQSEAIAKRLPASRLLVDRLNEYARQYEPEL